MPDWIKNDEVKNYLMEKLGVSGQPLKQEIIKWLSFDFTFDYHVTIQPYAPLSPTKIHKIVRMFGNILNQYCLGHNWYKYPSDQQSFYIYIFEKGVVESHKHIHLLLNLPPKKKLKLDLFYPLDGRRDRNKLLSEDLTSLGRRKYICPHGQIYFTSIKHGEVGQIAVANYILKQAYNENFDFGFSYTK